jgi:hypothetical protein
MQERRGASVESGVVMDFSDEVSLIAEAWQLSRDESPAVFEVTLALCEICAPGRTRRNHSKLG